MLFRSEAVRKHTRLPLEVHLMIEHPGNYIELYAKAGADIIQVQVECYGERRAACQAFGQYPKEVNQIFPAKLRADLKRIKDLGKRPYVVFNPGTPLIPDALTDCDGVLVMSVNPGYAGQKFMSHIPQKIEQLAKVFKGEIAVDGGVNGETALLCVKAGARVLITASYLYGSKDMAGTVRDLKAL